MTCAALLPGPLLAQTPSPAAAPVQAPSVPVPPAPATPAMHPARVHSMHEEEPYTFLGVETSHVPRVLSEQMNLPRGFGVVIDYVAPNSPAAAAGLQPDDILRMVNDQMIINPDQLGTLVRSFPEGTNVSLTIIRKGKEMKLSAQLRQEKTSARESGRDFEWNLKGLDRLRDLEGMKDFRAPDMTAINEAVARAKAQALRAGDEARRAAQRLRIITTEDGMTKTTHVDLGKAQIVLSDSKGELRLENVNGQKMLTAKDPSGKVQFRGPIDNAEERAKLPPEVQKRLESLEHQELPPVPPNEPEAPQPSTPNESVSTRNGLLQRASLDCGNRHFGWRRQSLIL